MNIIKRIEKIELAMNPGKGFCACPNVNKIELWKADLGEESNTSEPHLDGATVPDICEGCRQPIAKRIIILQLCDQTTKDRFPEEWNAERGESK